MENWKWHYDFIDMIKKGKPNEAHIAIHQWHEFCYLNHINFKVITQNIDGYDAQILRSSKVIPNKSVINAFTDELIELHGNV